MSTWLLGRISFFASTMDGWKNIFHRFRNSHLIHTFISDQRISVVLFQCSNSYIKLFAWNNQFTIDFLFAGLKYICISAFFSVSSFSRLRLMVVFVFSVCSTKVANWFCNSKGGTSVVNPFNWRIFILAMPVVCFAHLKKYCFAFWCFRNSAK